MVVISKDHPSQSISRVIISTPPPAKRECTGNNLNDPQLPWRQCQEHPTYVISIQNQEEEPFKVRVETIKIRTVTLNQRSK